MLGGRTIGNKNDSLDGNCGNGVDTTTNGRARHVSTFVDNRRNGLACDTGKVCGRRHVSKAAVSFSQVRGSKDAVGCCRGSSVGRPFSVNGVDLDCRLSSLDGVDTATNLAAFGRGVANRPLAGVTNKVCNRKFRCNGRVGRSVNGASFGKDLSCRQFFGGRHAGCLVLDCLFDAGPSRASGCAFCSSVDRIATLRLGSLLSGDGAHKARRAFRTSFARSLDTARHLGFKTGCVTHVGGDSSQCCSMTTSGDRALGPTGDVRCGGARGVLTTCTR